MRGAVDSVSLQRLKELAPGFARKLHTVLLVLESEGINMRIVQGLRSWQQQDDLYAQGRSRPGNIVTKVKGGYSWHCFGLAADCVPDADPDTPGFQPEWDAHNAHYARFVAVAKAQGLVAGAEWRTFPDYPHVQAGEVPVSPTDEVRQAFKDGGMFAVWTMYGLET